MDKQPVCEVCGNPARHIVWDLFVSDNWDTGMREHSHNGKGHPLCDEHNRDSNIADVTESPLTWFYRKQGGSK